MTLRVRYLLKFATVAAAFALHIGDAGAQGYADFPYSIMAPERGAAHGQRMRSHARERHAFHKSGKGSGGTYSGRDPRQAMRGSSGSVLPTPLPRTPLIPPEGNGAAIVHATPSQQQGLTIVPGAPGLRPVPNLPHGGETFQDRASRCAFQQGLYNVPGNLTTQYMGACLQ